MNVNVNDQHIKGLSLIVEPLKQFR
jgi:hypothetical protein